MNRAASIQRCAGGNEVTFSPDALAGSPAADALMRVCGDAMRKEDATLKGIKAVGMAVRVTEKNDGTTNGDVRYFITSRYLTGKRLAQAVRGHWGIENSLHWVLDVTFDEDQSRTRKRRIADNLSWLRRFAISLLKRHPSNHSVKGKSEMAGWSNEFLMQVLTAQGI